MVASISARKSVGAAVSYFKHMAHDEYYTGKAEIEAEADGEWDGRGAERLALEGPVSKAEFEAALNGIDPMTGERLTQIGKSHAPGWDMTFSAPKSVSVMWALSPPADRKTIEAAHRLAVHAATTHLEDHHAFTRRGKGGAKAIPRDIERAFSKRRQAIEQAADTYGYRTPKGMELAALRTRQAKRPRERAALFQAWQAEARMLGFDVAKARQLQVQVGGQTHHVPTRDHQVRTRSPARMLPSAQRLINAIAIASRASSSMQGVQINLRQKADGRDNDRER